MSKLTLALGLLLLFFSACEPEQNPPTTTPTTTFDTRPYYFPIHELDSGLIYEYRAIQAGNSYLSHFWWLQQQVVLGDTFLIWKRYNPQFQIDQYLKEWIVADGAIVKEYTLFAYDSSGQWSPYPVEQNAVFPFHPSTDSNMVYRYSAMMTLPPDYVTVRLNRDRRFAGLLSKETLNYEGQPVVAFESTDLYDIEDQAKGGNWQKQAKTIEFYAKGIGLVKIYDSAGEGEPSQVTLLAQRYTPAEFEQLRQAHQATQH